MKKNIKGAILILTMVPVLTFAGCGSKDEDNQNIVKEIVNNQEGNSEERADLYVSVPNSILSLMGDDYKNDLLNNWKDSGGYTENENGIVFTVNGNDEQSFYDLLNSYLTLEVETCEKIENCQISYDLDNYVVNVSYNEENRDQVETEVKKLCGIIGCTEKAMDSATNWGVTVYINDIGKNQQAGIVIVNEDDYSYKWDGFQAEDSSEVSESSGSSEDSESSESPEETSEASETTETTETDKGTSGTEED